MIGLFKKIGALVTAICIVSGGVAQNPSVPGVKKIKDVLIYKDSAYYNSFPSIVKKPDGELLLAFRRAPNRMIFGEKGNNHTDHNSYLIILH